MDKLRIRFGLLWPSWHPPIDTIMNWLIGIAAACLLMVVQGFLDERDHAIQLQVKSAREAAKFRNLFDTCLNGGIVGRSGHVFLSCKGAEEINLGNIQLINPITKK